MSNAHFAAEQAHLAAAQAWEACYNFLMQDEADFASSDAASEIASELTALARKYSRRAQKVWSSEGARKLAAIACQSDSPSDTAAQEHRAAAFAHREAAKTLAAAERGG